MGIQGLWLVHKTVHGVDNFAEKLLNYDYCKPLNFPSFNFFTLFAANFVPSSAFAKITQKIKAAKNTCVSFTALFT